MYFIGSAVGLFVSACSVSQKIASRENQAVATKCVLESVLIRPGEIASLLISLHRCQVNETPSNWSASEQPFIQPQLPKMSRRLHTLHFYGS